MCPGLFRESVVAVYEFDELYFETMGILEFSPLTMLSICHF